MYHPRTPRCAVNVSFHATYICCGADSNGGDSEKRDYTAGGLRDVSRYINPDAGASEPAGPCTTHAGDCIGGFSSHEKRRTGVWETQS